METLVETAKRMGINPNPNMTDEEYLKIKGMLVQELRKLRQTSEDDLDVIMYDLRKNPPFQSPRQFDSVLFENNISRFKSEFEPGVSSYSQQGDWWHSAINNGEKTIERFAASVKLDDSRMPEIFKRLDQFILQHHSGYKVISGGMRTDTLNLYMTEPITPEIAKEFYEIVKPVLQEENHEFLDGFPVMDGDKQIKGIKFAPEANQEVSWDNDILPMKQRLEAIFPPAMVSDISKRTIGDQSLGEISVKVQLCDLLYYLIGREGQNPIQLGNRFGVFGEKYDKKIDVAAVGSAPKTPVSQSIDMPQSAVNMGSVSSQEQTGIQDLMQQMRMMQEKIQASHAELLQLQQGNAQLRENLAKLRQENAQLSSQNQILRSQVQSLPSTSVISKNSTVQ